MSGMIVLFTLSRKPQDLTSHFVVGETGADCHTFYTFTFFVHHFMQRLLLTLPVTTTIPWVSHAYNYCSLIHEKTINKANKKHCDV